MENRRGQVAIFVIIAILIVGTIVVLYIFRDRIFPSSVPADFVPVYGAYDSCIKQEMQNAIYLAGTQGGRIDAGAYIPGSDYAPFSSQLNFLGFPVPYWYYISGNGLVKENVPTLAGMQNEIAKYITDRLGNCNFDKFYAQGFDITIGQPTAKVTVTNTNVNAVITSRLTVRRGTESATKTSFNEDITSKLGTFYSTAVGIYNYEKKNAIFEKYAVDTLWNYAPVTGVEIDCSAKVWRTQDVINELKQGLQANMGAVKFKGNYYTLQNKEEEYYVINSPVSEPVNLLYSPSWPTKVEIYGEGAGDNLIVAQPVGNQEGMGIMGFCYIPYQYVYDVSFPVMVQIHEGTELFQFPMAVIIDNNQPRQASVSPDVELGIGEKFDLCQYNTQDVDVKLYDTNLRAVNGNISYSCFDQTCPLGETQGGEFVGKMPACVNGQLVVKADGYADKTELFSSNSESSASLILDKEYNIKVNVNKKGQDISTTGDTAIAIFTNRGNGNTSTSANIPGSTGIILLEGWYGVTVYVYSNASISIPKTTKEQCYETSAGGIMGFLGQTTEKCINIEIPATTIDNALVGGGMSEIYILPSDLEKGKITLNVDSLKKPKTIEELADNFAKFSALGVSATYG